MHRWLGIIAMVVLCAPETWKLHGSMNSIAVVIVYVGVGICMTIIQNSNKQSH